MDKFLDPYRRDDVGAYLALPVQVIGGGLVSLLLHFGDRFAVSCSMILTDEQLRDPRIIERVCSGIDFAFRLPGTQTDCAADSYPVYSAFLLERLLRAVSDQQSRSLIEKTLASIRMRIPDSK
jgi:hypothetical protein